MNHRRSPGGYHNRLKAGTLVLALLPGCSPLAIPPAPQVDSVPGQPWRAEREAIVAQINSARAEAGLAPLTNDATLERVGNAHCAILVAENGQGHFSASGVPPYLRYLLAGGHGFHRENAAMFSSSAVVPEQALPGILARNVASMLGEFPPEDGHRRSLLDPDVNRIGVGLAISGGEVRMTHELAAELTVAWSPPSAVTRPKTVAALSGKLAPPWRPVMAEVLWESLPRTLAGEKAAAIHSYAYPPRRDVFDANRPLGQRPVSGENQHLGPLAVVPFTVDRFGNFSLRWVTGPGEGVEIVVIAASDGRRGELVPVAASATVVTVTGGLPPELALWRQLAGAPGPPRGDQP